MVVEIVPCLKDNYAYLISVADGVVVVDPSQAEPVLAALNGRRIAAIWCTHHHWDHTGGVSGLNCDVVCGSAYDLEHKRIEGQTRGLREGDDVGYGFKVMEVPGHTLGALTYVGNGMAFTGDTLFLAGCGRVFEGDYPMMYASLQRFTRLPPETLLYVGHEYTAANLRFAGIARDIRVPSVPGTVAQELRDNVFLRAKNVAEFSRLRDAKNSS